MPDIQNPLSQKLNFLHALWANPDAPYPQDLVATFKDGTEGDGLLARYKEACTGDNVAEATSQLAAIRDLLLTPKANG